WHRAYQHVMEKAGREQELRPRYQQLVAETGGQLDALYLLARVEDLDESDKLLHRAATANPPSAPALHSLGFRALAAGRFAIAARWREKAGRLAPGRAGVGED